MDARVVDDPGEALDEVSLVVTATTSHEPALPDDVPEGVFIAAVGAFNPEMAELTPDLVVSSSVVVDTIEGVREKAGDLMQAGFRPVRPEPLVGRLYSATRCEGGKSPSGSSRHLRLTG